MPPKPKSPINALQKSKSSGDVSKPPNAAKDLEKELLRELIYSFQGIEGTMIRRNPKNDTFSIIETHRSRLSPSVIQLSQRLAEMGWLFTKIQTFCNDLGQKKENGLVSQSLVIALKKELSEYYRLLSTLEAQLEDESTPTSLVHLAVWTLQPTNRLKLLVSIVEACKGLKGGALISQVYSFLKHGDSGTSKSVQAILCTVCQPMYLMLLR